MAKSFYETLKGLVPPAQIDHHASDLYVLDTPVARLVIRQFGLNSSSFTSQIDGKRWLDVPFAYEPFWEKKSKRSHATIASPASSAKSKRAPKTKIIYVVQGNYGYGQGWEDVTAEETSKEARDRIREYRENERGVPFRLIRRRERIAA